jgi:anti-sigma B factor antagonist
MVSYARPMRELDISTEKAESDAIVLSLTGEVDLYTCPELKTELLRVIDEGAKVVVVDLSGTTFIDSTGLAVLIRGAERLRTSDGRLTVVVVDPSLRKIFEVTGLDRIFTIHGSRDEALAQTPS